MPLFYFDIDDGEFAADPCGEDLPDLDAARLKALELATGVIQSTLGACASRRWSLGVTDGMGIPVLAISMTVQHGRFQISEMR